MKLSDRLGSPHLGPYAPLRSPFHSPVPQPTNPRQLSIKLPSSATKIISLKLASLPCRRITILSLDSSLPFPSKHWHPFPHTPSFLMVVESFRPSQLYCFQKDTSRGSSASRRYRKKRGGGRANRRLHCTSKKGIIISCPKPAEHKAQETKLGCAKQKK